MTMMDAREEDAGRADADASPLPRWLRVSLGVVGTLLIVVLLYVGSRRHGHGAAGAPTAPAAARPEFPAALPTIWPGITVRVDSVAWIGEDLIIAEWAYVNTAIESDRPFAWGENQPNVVALSKLTNASRTYTVAVSDGGHLLCASTNRDGDGAGSRVIYPGRDLPVWAEFRVSSEIVEPLRLSLYGVNRDGDADFAVPVLTLAEQVARAFVPRPTSWPGIWIRLVRVERLSGGRVRVSWQYLNRDPDKRFAWGFEEPNFVARTQLYDLEKGVYYAVSDRAGAVSSTNRPDGAGWSLEIAPGGAVDAFAEFDDVAGERLQLLFHSAVPLYMPPVGAADTN